MANNRYHRRRRSNRSFVMLCGVLAALIVCCVIVGVVVHKKHASQPDPVAPALAQAASPEPEATQEIVEPTAEPEAAPALAAATEEVPAVDGTEAVDEGALVEEPVLTPEATREARADGADAMVAAPSAENAQKLANEVRPDVVEGFLPVCYGLKTDQKVVAITIDDCNQPENLKQILKIINSYGGKATIFPIGQNVEKCGEILKAAWESGFEIENHTWDHCGLYNVDDDMLAKEIWSQNAKVSQILGVDYQMHFLRPRGGDNRYDQRTHAYMRQMGYYGLAYWTQVGIHSSTDSLMQHLAPGNIFLYHTTDEDLAQLSELVPRLHEAGYTMVTLNELYGLPANETAPLTEKTQAPVLAPYTRMEQTLNPGDYLRDVYLVQEELTKRGFLTAEYNGYYGKVTKQAVMDFQKSAGLTADGICGPDTWKALFGEN